MRKSLFEFIIIFLKGCNKTYIDFIINLLNLIV